MRLGLRRGRASHPFFTISFSQLVLTSALIQPDLFQLKEHNLKLVAYGSLFQRVVHEKGHPLVNWGFVSDGLFSYGSSRLAALRSSHQLTLHWQFISI